MRLLIGLGFNATSMQKNDLWQALSLCRETGLRFVELTAGISASAMIRVDYKTKELLGIRHQLRQDGISVCAIGAHRDLSREESLHQFLTLLSHAANIGCPIVTTGIPDGCNEDAFSDGLYQAACRQSLLV